MRITLPVCCIYLLLLNHACADEKFSSEVSALLSQACRDGQSETHDFQELSRAEKLFLRTFSSQATDFSILHREWEHLQMSLEKATTGDMWYLREQQDSKRGRGFYCFRISSTSPIVIQAPHHRYDKGTGTIALKLFGESDVRAVAWNTLHRQEQDLAHEEETWLQAFTRATAKFEETLLVVQIHGFSNKLRKSEEARMAHLILSSGSDTPPAWFGPTSLLFIKSFSEFSVLAYPFQVRELGATTNVQGKLLRNGTTHFLHLECNPHFRKVLLDEDSLRSNLMECLSTTLRFLRSEPF